MTNLTSEVFLGLFSRGIPKLRRASFRNKGDYVILVHGLLVGAFSMQKISTCLDVHGFQVLNFKCSMKKYSIPVIASKFLHNFVIRHCLDKTKKIHFVTHSIGGIVVRDYIQKHNLINVSRVVMLAPPNNGSEMYTKFNKPLFQKWFLGIAGKQVANKDYLDTLHQKVGFDLGVIAANKSMNPFSFLTFNRENDGVVSVSSTKIIGMKSHVVIPTTHYFMLFNNEVIRQILTFLSRGKFDKG
jgi:triacylglycerol esterase/lipase EstA (alpha/beta hydrolase family)